MKRPPYSPQPRMMRTLLLEFHLRRGRGGGDCRNAWRADVSDPNYNYIRVKADTAMDPLLRRLLDPPFGTETSERNLMSDAAAEITRLQARLAAAEKLAEAGGAMIDFHNGPAGAKRPDIWQRLLQRFAVALSAFQEGGK